MVIEINFAAIDEVSVFPVVGHAGIELARNQHGADAFLRWNLIDGDPGRRPKADRTSVAAGRDPLHEEVHILGRDPELVFEDAAGPKRRSLYVFRYADALAFE